jgi:hypothetical protein
VLSRPRRASGIGRRVRHAPPPSCRSMGTRQRSGLRAQNGGPAPGPRPVAKRSLQPGAGRQRTTTPRFRPPFFRTCPIAPLAFDNGLLGPVAHAARCITAANGAGLPRGSTGTIQKIDSEGAAGKNSPGGPADEVVDRGRAEWAIPSLALKGLGDCGFPCKPEAQARDVLHVGDPAARSPGRVSAVQARRSRHRRGS